MIACQGPMGPRDIKPILLKNKHLHLDQLYVAFGLNGVARGA